MYFITIGKRQRQQTFPAHGLFTTSPIWPLSCSSQAPGPPRTGWLWELKCVEPDGVAHHDPHPHPQERSPPRWARAAPLLILYPRDQASHVPSLTLSFPIYKGRAFLCTQFLWILGPTSGHKRGTKGLARHPLAGKGRRLDWNQGLVPRCAPTLPLPERNHDCA